MSAAAHHTPVLLKEVIALLDPKDGETVLDVTLGLGGHTEEFLRRVGSTGKVIGLDADRQNLSQAQQRLRTFQGQLECRHANFINLAALDLPKADLLFADLGLSSPHVDDASRGFTFREDVPLDLRFDRTCGVPASQWLSQISLEQLAHVLHHYGEIRGAHRLAEKLKESDMTTTFSVVRAVESVFSWRAKSVMAQVFQALRIALNDEMAALEALLMVGPSLLKEGGRMGVISYHSLEDRQVKQSFRRLGTVPKHPETGQDLHAPEFLMLTRKATVPSDEEVRCNPRSRSAKLRVIMRAK